LYFRIAESGKRCLGAGPSVHRAKQKIHNAFSRSELLNCRCLLYLNSPSSKSSSIALEYLEMKAVRQIYCSTKAQCSLQPNDSLLHRTLNCTVHFLPWYTANGDAAIVSPGIPRRTPILAKKKFIPSLHIFRHSRSDTMQRTLSPQSGGWRFAHRQELKCRKLDSDKWPALHRDGFSLMIQEGGRQKGERGEIP
jgi:hypothetical protein